MISCDITSGHEGKQGWPEMLVQRH